MWFLFAFICLLCLSRSRLPMVSMLVCPLLTTPEQWKAKPPPGWQTAPPTPQLHHGHTHIPFTDRLNYIYHFKMSFFFSCKNDLLKPVANFATIRDQIFFPPSTALLYFLLLRESGITALSPATGPTFEPSANRHVSQPEWSEGPPETFRQAGGAAVS